MTRILVIIRLVIEASLLQNDGSDGDLARERLRDERLAAPELIDLEVVSVLRRLLAVGKLDVRRAQLALDDLIDLPIQRARHRPLLVRAWELRDNVSVYDAAYVALAEALGAPLLTADARLAKAPGLRCPVELLRPATPSRRRRSSR